MGRSCCVPGCRSNYGKISVSAFLFPKDKTLRDKWLKCIRRKNFKVSDHSVVCIKHFDRRFLVTEDIFIVLNDKPIRLPRKKPRLVKGAYPTIFPGQFAKHLQSRKSTVDLQEIKSVTDKAETSKSIDEETHKSIDEETPKSIDQNSPKSIDQNTPKSIDQNTPKSIDQNTWNNLISEKETRSSAMLNCMREDQNLNSVGEVSETKEDDHLARIKNEIDRYENVDYEAENFDDNCVIFYKQDGEIFINNKLILNTYCNSRKEEKKSIFSYKSLRLLPIMKTYNADIQNQLISGIRESNETQLLVYNEAKRQYDFPPSESSLDEFSTYLILPRSYVNIPDNISEEQTETDKCLKLRNSEGIGGNNNTELSCECGSCQQPSILDRIEVKSFYDIPYSCSLCQQKMYTKVSVRKHIKWHMSMEIYTCNYCEQRFSCKKPLHNHMLMHIEGYKPYTSFANGSKTFKPLMCKGCGEVIILKERLKHHLRCRGEKTWYDCNRCHKTYPSKKLLKLHTLLHAELRYFKCEICEKCFTNASTWSKHIKFVHTDEKRYECADCCKRFKRRKALMAHLAVHDNSVKHICDVCGKSFKFISNLRAHELIHQPDYSSIKQMKKLAQSSITKNSVKQTVKRIVTCNLCGKSLMRSTLYHHLMSHKDAPRKCDICNKIYKNELYLKAHVRLIHRNEERCQCKVCGKQFKQKRLLKIHEKVHLGVKNFLCTLCGKRFVYASNLHTHLKFHSGVKNYECAECGKKFTYRYRLKEHMFLHIRDIVPFKGKTTNILIIKS